MKTIYLKDFIRTGKFENITLGSQKKEVVALFGSNYDFYNAGKSQIIKFGWYEFFYDTATETINGIQNDHLLYDCVNHKEMITLKNKKIELDLWFLKPGQNITFKEVKVFLTLENIKFEVQPTYKGCEENIIKCESGVFFDFASESGTPILGNTNKLRGWKEIKAEKEDDFLLNGIRLFDTMRMNQSS